MNLIPIVALESFFDDEPPLFGLGPFCLEFAGVVLASSGLAVPGFHIMVNTTVRTTYSDLVFAAVDGKASRQAIDLVGDEAHIASYHSFERDGLLLVAVTERRDERSTRTDSQRDRVEERRRFHFVWYHTHT